MALEIIDRLNPGSTENYISLTSTSINAALNYDTTGMDLLLVNLVLASGVIGTVVVTLYASIDGGASYSALTTYTTAGLQTMVRITGANRIRLATTTADAGAGTICPVVRAGVDLNG